MFEVIWFLEAPKPQNPVTELWTDSETHLSISLALFVSLSLSVCAFQLTQRIWRIIQMAISNVVAGSWRAHKICPVTFKFCWGRRRDKTTKVKFVWNASWQSYRYLFIVLRQGWDKETKTEGQRERERARKRRDRKRVRWGNAEQYTIFAVRVWHDFLVEKSNRLVMPSPQTWEFFGLGPHLSHFSWACRFCFFFSTVVFFFFLL